MPRFLLLVIVLFSYLNLYGQQEDEEKKVYKVNYWIDVPITITGYVTNEIGLRIVRDKPALDESELQDLHVSDINWLDRSAAKQSYDFYSTAIDMSDFGLAASLSLPVILFVDKEIRSDWLDIALLYLEAEAIGANVYSWLCTIHIDRYRPLTYNTGFPTSERIENLNRNSFFSGHTSSTAAASFFMAKVYCDYHPDLGNKKYLVYSAALVPPGFVGFFRYKSGKHFPTDVLAGMVVGGSVGILVPHLHKQKSGNLSIRPYSGYTNGITLNFRF